MLFLDAFCMYTAVFVLPPAGWVSGCILYLETGKALVLLLRDHGSFTPVASAPLHSLGSTAHGRTDPASTLGLWLCRSIIIPLYLSSPPSGCNPDSDSSPWSLSPVGGHGEFGVNLAWYFNADTSNVPSDLYIQFSKSNRGEFCLFFEAEIFVPLFIRNKLGDFSIYFLQGKSKKGLGCNQLGTTEAKTLCIF